MRWILHRPDGSIERGNGAPPDEPGVLHFVDEQGSARFDREQGAFHKDGARKGPGTHRISLSDGDMPIYVNAMGKATRRAFEPKGGDKSGNGNGNRSPNSTGSGL